MVTLYVYFLTDLLSFIRLVSVYTISVFLLLFPWLSSTFPLLYSCSTSTFSSFSSPTIFQSLPSPPFPFTAATVPFLSLNRCSAPQYLRFLYFPTSHLSPVTILLPFFTAIFITSISFCPCSLPVLLFFFLSIPRCLSLSYILSSFRLLLIVVLLAFYFSSFRFFFLLHMRKSGQE